MTNSWMIGNAELPNAPEAFALTSGTLSSRSFGIEWSMPSGNRSDNILQYRLSLRYTIGVTEQQQYSLIPAAANCTAGCSFSGSGNTITPATTYALRLAAENTLGPSLETDEVAVTTLTAAPELVGSPAVTGVTGSSLAVSWSAPAANGQPVTLYRVWACDADSGGCTTEEVSGTPPSTSATVGSLPSGRNYTVGVEAVNGVGSSGSANVTGAYTTLDAPMRVGGPFLA